jgi:uncharacterized membrane protein (UPF0182 family)
MTARPTAIHPAPRRRRHRLAVGIGLFVLFLAVPTLVRLAAEWPWFQALGFERVFVTRIIARLLLGAAVGVVAFVFLYVNLRIAQRGSVPEQLIRLAPQAEPIHLTRFVKRLVLPAALFVAVLSALAGAGMWLDALRFLHQTPFGAADPVFGRDVSYYVFTVPVVARVIRFLTFLTIFSLLASILLYALRRDIAMFGPRVTVEPAARVHVAVLLAFLFVLTALRVHLVQMPQLLYSTTGPLVGASFADLHGKLLGLRLAAFAAVVAAGIALWGARGPRLSHAVLVSAGVYFGVSILAVGIYPALVNRLVVAPNELAKEAPQLESHIASTRRAWGLDSVVTRDLTGEARLSERDIHDNAATIDNIRLWDRDPLLQTFGQLQEIRTYYDFLSVDDDRYWIDGKYRQVLLSPRELNTASLPTRTFINERLTFTHGMGLTLGPVNQITSEGLPVLFIKDLPPISGVSLKVTRPEIYYGEITDSWVFARTGQREFDYPSGDDNVYTSYEGDGGVRVGSLARRLVFAAYFRSLKTLLSSDITSDSRVLFFRNIRARARKALPFLSFDNDPYLVIDDEGRLKWILDAYTWTNRYPYAQPIGGGVNYMRNSVKVTIDAYDGALTAYVADPADPLVLTLEKVFPGIFRPLDDMPADLRAHLRYPETLFRVQSDLYATYHMDEPETFYHREDQWQKPVFATEGSTRDPFLRHIVMRLPGESDAEFIFMVPFTPRGKDNLASWMVARNDGEHYGKLVVYRLPKQSLVFGPTQIVNRINQDTEISRQVSLWDQRGSQVIRGHLLVIPIEESLIYVQPIYLRAEGGRIPELKRVVIAYQNQVVMENSLDAGLARLFGGEMEAAGVSMGAAAPEQTPTAGSTDAAARIRQAREAYQRAVSAQRAGDWARYGEELKRLDDALKRLEAATGRN